VNRSIDASVGVAVEVVGVQELRDLVDRIVPQEDAAENAPFGVEILRRKSIGNIRSGTRDRRHDLLHEEAHGKLSVA